MCRYGYRGVCASLPVDGVSDTDYVDHVMKYHMNPTKDSPEQWSVYMAAQNLPAVLNDPSRGKQSNIFTKKWGDSFIEKVHISPSPLLPKITLDNLDTYIRQVGKRYRRHVRLNQQCQLPTASNSVNGDGIEINHEQATSSSQLNNANSELNDAKLSDIPSIFTKPNLDFGNGETFEAVFPGVTDADNHKAGRLLQEKLSHYLDIVEVLIAKQVSADVTHYENHRSKKTDFSLSFFF